MKKSKSFLFKLFIYFLATSMLFGCSSLSDELNSNESPSNQTTIEQDILESENNYDSNSEYKDKTENEDIANSDPMFDGYMIIEVDGGDLSGIRQPNVAVDIGYGEREYWSFTNDYGQVVKVVAKEIVLQKDTEPLTSEGRYYEDEAKVPGTEQSNLDEGHIIADSLGGVSNAYNITPQDSTLNRHGDQAYMEKVIRDAGGCTNFIAIITYPNTSTQIPSHYEFTYTLKGNVIVDSFPNKNPEIDVDDPDDTKNSVAIVPPVTKDPTDNDTITHHYTYVLNTNTKKFHYENCSSVDQMKDKNKEVFTGSRDDVVARGFEACKRCNP